MNISKATVEARIEKLNKYRAAGDSGMAALEMREARADISALQAPHIVTGRPRITVEEAAELLDSLTYHGKDFAWERTR